MKKMAMFIFSVFILKNSIMFLGNTSKGKETQLFLNSLIFMAALELNQEDGESKDFIIKNTLKETIRHLNEHNGICFDPNTQKLSEVCYR